MKPTETANQSVQPFAITDLNRCEAEARALRDAYLADATARLVKRAARALQSLFSFGAATRSA